MLTRNHPIIRGPINHEHIVIKYEPPTQAKSCAFDHMARSHDSDAGSTDSGRPPSLTEHKEKVFFIARILSLCLTVRGLIQENGFYKIQQ